MDALEKQLAEVRNEIDNILSPYGLTINSPSHEIVSDKDWDKVYELREREGELESMISFRESLNRDNGISTEIEGNKKEIMEMDAARIFLLVLKKSVKREGTTYCIGVFKLGTPAMEFILGEMDKNREYRAGDEVPYIYNADYTGNLQEAMEWLNAQK